MHLNVMCMVIFCSGLCNAEIFSSFAKTRQLISHMRLSNITDILSQYIEQRRTWLSYYRILSGTSAKYRRAVLDNENFDILKPLCAFKYLYMTAEPKKDGRHNIKTLDVKTAVLKYLNGLPTMVDLDGIAKAILSAQEVHALPTNDVARGLFRGRWSRPLHLTECFDLATFVQKMAYYRRFDYVAKSVRYLEWLRATKDLVQTSREAALLYKPFLDVLSFINCTCSLYSHKLFRSLEKFHPALQIPKNCLDLPRERCTITDQQFRKQYPFDVFEAICRGEAVPETADMDNRTPTESLKCKYVDNNDRLLILAPMKVEELNHVTPYIALVHDVITDKTAHILKSTSRLRSIMERKGEKGPPESSRHVQLYNIAETEISPRVYSSVRRLSAFTKLTDDGTKSTTVLNYGSAGMNMLHNDVHFAYFGQVNENMIKNPIVTVQIFLNDVIDGGEEVFPLLGIKVKPVRNSALVYYNLYKNGYTNNYAIHGSCPVMYGDKWIVRHYIYNHGQELSYPCGLDQFE